MLCLLREMPLTAISGRIWRFFHANDIGFPPHRRFLKWFSTPTPEIGLSLENCSKRPGPGGKNHA
jgi:hypothetical protein